MSDADFIYLGALVGSVALLVSYVAYLFGHTRGCRYAIERMDRPAPRWSAPRPRPPTALS